MYGFLNGDVVQSKPHKKGGRMNGKMDIRGLMKLTLLDFPGKVACTVFTGGCDFRCPFCHNASLVLDPASVDPVGEEAVMALLEKRKGVMDGVCVTGGEPTLQKDLAGFLARIKEKGLLVKLDTNGSRPDVLAQVIEDGLVDYVAMDIKNSPAGYAKTVGIADFDMTDVKKSAALLLEGRVDYEFRTTVVRELHRLSDFADMAEWLAGARVHYLQRFVDSGDVIAPGFSAWDDDTMEKFRRILAMTEKRAELRGVG